MLSLIGGLLLSGLVSRQVSRGKKEGREEGEAGGRNDKMERYMCRYRYRYIRTHRHTYVYTYTSMVTYGDISGCAKVFEMKEAGSVREGLTGNLGSRSRSATDHLRNVGQAASVLSFLFSHLRNCLRPLFGSTILRSMRS